MRGDPVLFEADNHSVRTLIQTASLTGIEVSRGMHSHVWRGAGIGFLVGGLARGVVGYSFAHRPPADHRDYGPLVGAAGAVLVGGVGVPGGAGGGTEEAGRWERL